MTGATPLASGTQLGGGHEIKKVLGQGGFGITYMVESPAGEMLAIKEFCPARSVTRVGDSLHVAPEGAADFRSGYQLFKKEAETLRDHPHPNIVGVRALFEKNATIYMVMEFIDGEPLQNALVRGRTFSEAESLDLLGQSIVALGFLHENHVHQHLGAIGPVSGVELQAL
ncbi:MAG: protein kinase, partial [Pseudomonadota bacterium]